MEIEFIKPSKVYLFQLALYSLLLGVLLEWKALKQLFNGKVGINHLIIPCIICGVISFIPKYKWMGWFGAVPAIEGWEVLVTPFYIDGTHIILAILSGILLVRSVTKQSDNKL